MLRSCLAFLQELLGIARVRITDDSPARLAVRCGGSLTDFHRQTGDILQNSRLVASFSTVERVELRQVQRARESPRWEIGLCLEGDRHVRVGQSPEPEEASIVAAHIATATGKPVSVNPTMG